MIRLNEIKVKIDPEKRPPDKERLHSLLKKKAAQLLGMRPEEILEIRLVRRSVDARKKPEIYYSYVIDVQVKGGSAAEQKISRRQEKGRRASAQIQRPEEMGEAYVFPEPGERKLAAPVVIVGTGPAGLFCGYYLAIHGYRPILLERGKDVDARRLDVEKFWQGGRLLPDSNVQFGEGGAGTFSDGKLNTQVKDKYGRNKEVLKTFVQFGAPEVIQYDAKPHIGTDVLCGVVKKMREEIVRLGGSVRFESKVTDLLIREGRVQAVMVNGQEEIPCSACVLAIGHSARDTFSLLWERGLPMEAKSFAVGFRVEHPQSVINEAMYGCEDPGFLGAAPYKVTAKTRTGRGVYSFCMCPGGYVVNASSEEGRLAVNGMSYSGRDGSNANSAVIVAVTPEDFPSDHPLAGIEFQRELEKRAYELAGGKIPVQRFGDFKHAVEKVAGTGRMVQGEVAETASPDRGCLADTQEIPVDSRGVASESVNLQPQHRGLYAWADLTGILPEECNEALVEGMEVFGRQIPGFDRPETILAGVESRTSSPVRILRDSESFQAVVGGLYPCGEGAGYAGGITSAAMDGMRVAEAIAREFAPVE